MLFRIISNPNRTTRSTRVRTTDEIEGNLRGISWTLVIVHQTPTPIRLTSTRSYLLRREIARKDCLCGRHFETVLWFILKKKSTIILLTLT